MLELHDLVPAPLPSVTDDGPYVARVALALVAKGRHLLVVGQRRGEVVRVQVATGGQVLQAQFGAALDRVAALAVVLQSKVIALGCYTS